MEKEEEREREKRREGEMVSACERSTLFDAALACVTMAAVCVTMVLACEIPHTRYPADPGTTPAMQTSDLPPKYGTDDEPGGGAPSV